MLKRHTYAFCAVLVGSLLLGACTKPQQNKQAVEKGLMEYLRTKAGLNVKDMDVSVTSVSFRENEAEAAVSFNAKGSKDSASSMQMKYVLEQKDGKWVVKGRAGGSEHGAGQGGAAPQGGGAPQGGQALPPGHPPAPGDPGAKPGAKQ